MNIATDERTGVQGVSSAPESASWQGTSMKDSAQQAKAKIGQARETLKEKGSEAAQRLQNQGREFAHTRKDEFGQRIKGSGAAVRRAAEKLREEEDPNIAQYAEMVADRLDQAGNYFQGKDFTGIYRDLENSARRRPELLFGAMFVAGLALSRFLKASSERPSSTSEYPPISEGQDWPEASPDAALMTDPGAAASVTEGQPDYSVIECSPCAEKM